ncbi:MAG: AIR synthase related protein [Candidatus Thermoplasmatota archaeon]
MDLEELTRRLLHKGKTKLEILNSILEKIKNKEKAMAIIKETENSEKIDDEFLEYICKYIPSGIDASYSGLGCRGTGDFLIHRKIAEIGGVVKANVGIEEQDDGGAIKFGKKYIIVSVDGVHSRLTNFPFIAGFHVARAAIRDVICMGAEPKALFSDVHIANDGDVSKVFEYIAGISLVSEVLSVPLIGGSTLRIGGDMVLGDRLVGCVGCLGIADEVKKRKGIKKGDLLLMTEGAGGGTIATTAIYNGLSKVAMETINLNLLTLGKKLLNTNIMKKINGMLDVTNGGIRGDSWEVSKSNSVKIILNNKKIEKLINENVRKMLSKLKIDFMGISLDAFLFSIPKEHANELIEFISMNGMKCDIVGRVEKGFGVYLENGKLLKQKFREAPYTPIKRVVDVRPENINYMRKKIEESAKNAIEKKKKVKELLLRKSST